MITWCITTLPLHYSAADKCPIHVVAVAAATAAASANAATSLAAASTTHATHLSATEYVFTIGTPAEENVVASAAAAADEAAAAAADATAGAAVDATASAVATMTIVDGAVTLVTIHNA